MNKSLKFAFFFFGLAGLIAILILPFVHYFEKLKEIITVSVWSTSIILVIIGIGFAIHGIKNSKTGNPFE